MDHITVPIEIAKLIDKVFLPINPNKMRSATPEVVRAVVGYKSLLRKATLSAERSAS